MNVSIQPQSIQGTVQIAPSKSVFQRTLAAALLFNGKTRIENYGISNDDKAALAIIQQLGATVTIIDETRMEIHSTGFPNERMQQAFHCGESGLSFRMFCMIAATAAKGIQINAEGTLRDRPLNIVAALLHSLGVRYQDEQGHFPIQIQGPLVPQNITIDGSITSQLLTGLLLAYANAPLTEEVTISVQDLKSKPYIDITLSVIEQFGMNMPVNNDYQTFTFAPGANAQTKTQVQTLVEGDWSNAAFFLVAAAIGGDITVTGLDVFSTQADKKILEALQDCGCTLSIRADFIRVRHNTLSPFQFDATDCPDLFPPLVCLAACAEGTSVIEGVSRLLHKESNRAQTLQEEMARLGILIEIQDDYMLVRGTGIISGGIIDSRADHRIAMAGGIMALKASAEVQITHADAVAKSYPNFFEHLNSLCADKIKFEGTISNP
ncbi:3-phosphoshikimate 1-carboxyvinyltransferase [Taibaiella sp. KBW10]|uniref:3-phosphoshikimate 1-carboxyvinyltransferase n=1 Tax=Taibaiella sp. KBW10 TaxID=2153357 RepID=UPI000F59862C|nr:3-phosphoshikimate 1-carboxyvinyltransferase [Taibaiella sp. KBW10]RQO31763.1 3-phosphoshikimate 1-carboxyvinyltransferase [Taibaiella sp. KBW10]